MTHGICHLSIVPIRKEATDESEMISQLLFGEIFVVHEFDGDWLKVETAFDNVLGFVDRKQILSLSSGLFEQLKSESQTYAGEIIDFTSLPDGQLSMIPLGACLPFYNDQQCTIQKDKFLYDGRIYNGKLSKNEIVRTAHMYLNTPFLLGGKSPFGIDSAALCQMVYKLCGYHLRRTAASQSHQGEVLSFIEESEPGDLAFFDNEEGEIIHVGIILNDYKIIHAFGKVRIDTLDHSGIFNLETQKHTHKLRIIKKMI